MTDFRKKDYDITGWKAVSSYLPLSFNIFFKMLEQETRTHTGKLNCWLKALVSDSNRVIDKLCKVIFFKMTERGRFVDLRLVIKLDIEIRLTN